MGVMPRPPQADLRIVLDARPHPLTDEGRTVGPLVLPAGATIEELVDGRTEFRTVDTEILLDGEALPPARWSEPVPDGAVVALRPVIRGAVGRAVAGVLTIAAAIFVPPLLGLAAGTLGAALAGGAIAVVGGLVANALFPVRPPDLGGGLPGNVQADPVYSLTGGSNRARRYEALPLVLGTHRMFPDLAAAEYTENEGDDQYLNGLYHFGLGDLDVSELRNGSTLLSDYTGVQTELSGASGAVALVAGNVDTVAGAALEDTAWVTRQTGAGTGRIGVDFTGRIFRVTDRGAHVSNSVTVQIRWRQQNGAWTTRQRTLTHDDSGIYRTSFAFDLAASADWEIQVRRTAAPDGGEQVFDEVTWAALRAYQPDEADYTGQTRLGVRIKASGQLSGRLDRLSALVKQRVPVASNGAWAGGNVVTSNPAALFRWYARGVRIGGAVRAGVGLPDRRIDHDGLARWYAWCQSKGYRCDFVVQGNMTHDAVLALIAQCGRAAVSWKTGKLGVVWEDEAAMPSGMITPGNIVAGSFGVRWAAEPPADEVVVRYIEPELDWQYNSVRRNRPGLAGTPQSTATVTAKGVIDRDNAAIECNLQAARQHYHKRTLHWEMGREGRAFSKGDVVWITHSLIDGGTAGRVAGGDGRDLTLDQAVDVAEDGGWALIRTAAGALHMSEVSQPDGAGETIRLATPLAAPPASETGQPADLLYRLYDRARPPRRARIKGVEPLSATRFRFSAIDEVAAYHAAATSDLTVPFPDAYNRTPRVVAVGFSARSIRVGTGEVVELQAALSVVGQWTGAVVRAGATSAEQRTVDRLSGPADLVAKWIVPPGVGQQVEIVPGTLDSPDGPVWTGSWQAAAVAPPPPTNVAVTRLDDGTRQFTMTLPDWPSLAGVLIRYHATAGTDWAAMTPLHAGPLRSMPYESHAPAAGTWEFAVVTVDTYGRESEPLRWTATLGPAPSPDEGVEAGYAVTDASATAIKASYLPDNAWGFRQLGAAGRTTEPDGQGGTRVTDEGLTWQSAEPTTGRRNSAVWRVERAIVGQPAVGEAVAANWGAPELVSVTDARQWTKLWSGDLRINNGFTIELPEAVLSYDSLAFVMYHGLSAGGRTWYTTIVETTAIARGSTAAITTLPTLGSQTARVYRSTTNDKDLVFANGGGTGTKRITRIWAVDHPS
ncbi:MAG: host specificity factor TipJ family phage tail protein [Rhodospirillaceae bacterium]|nr:host specificity factor TipJ family phage tail protein [Rhodospirillaceae bacterium]